jgi:hypothetical protein
MMFGEFRDLLTSAPEFRYLTIRRAISMIHLHRAEFVGKPAPSVFIYIDEFRCLAKHGRRVKHKEIGSTVLGESREKLILEDIADRENALLTELGNLVSDEALNSVFLSTLDNRALRLNGTSFSVNLIELRKFAMFDMSFDHRSH